MSIGVVAIWAASITLVLPGVVVAIYILDRFEDGARDGGDMHAFEWIELEPRHTPSENARNERRRAAADVCVVEQRTELAASVATPRSVSSRGPEDLGCNAEPACYTDDVIEYYELRIPFDSD